MISVRAKGGGLWIARADLKNSGEQGTSAVTGRSRSARTLLKIRSERWSGETTKSLERRNTDMNGRNTGQHWSIDILVRLSEHYYKYPLLYRPGFPIAGEGVYEV